MDADINTKLMDMETQNQQIYNKDKHIAQLEATNRALADKLADLMKKQMQKHDKASLAWRDKYFYLKKQLDSIKSRKEAL